MQAGECNYGILYRLFKIKTNVGFRMKQEILPYESLHRKYGDETMATPYVCIDDVPNIESMSAQKIRFGNYENNIKLLFVFVRMRRFPARQRLVSNSSCCSRFFWGKAIQSSVSHLTIDFATVVFKGINHLEQKIQARLKDNLTSREKETLDGMQNVIYAMHIYHKRYLEVLKQHKPENYKILKSVPFEPATEF